MLLNVILCTLLLCSCTHSRWGLWSPASKLSGVPCCAAGWLCPCKCVSAAAAATAPAVGQMLRNSTRHAGSAALVWLLPMLVTTTALCSTDFFIYVTK
ncbi:hypothetical protein COO60DRAFT_1516369 [Scenedesmus sp. NREL 46B-D3]|nr:hypothetical protein COO60DRAFT_1516369 [Scenedesmus sp. NREL 46B-D3]